MSNLVMWLLGATRKCCAGKCHQTCLQLMQYKGCMSGYSSNSSRVIYCRSCRSKSSNCSVCTEGLVPKYGRLKVIHNSNKSGSLAITSHSRFSKHLPLVLNQRSERFCCGSLLPTRPMIKGITGTKFCMAVKQLTKTTHLCVVNIHNSARPASVFESGSKTSSCLSTTQEKEKISSDSVVERHNPSDCMYTAQTSVDSIYAQYQNLFSSTECAKYSRSEEKIKSVIHILLATVEISEQCILKLLTEEQSLLNLSMEQWKKTLIFLKSYGFKGDMIPSVILGYPHIFKDAQLFQKMEGLRNLGFQEGTIQKLITGHPMLLHANLKDIHNRFEMLLSLFSRPNVTNLCIQSPQVLTDNWEDLEEKIQYVEVNMGLPRGRILRSNLLSHSLQYIKTRHMLLQRAGLFKRPNKHGFSEVENPSLKKIVSTSDVTFATKVAKVTLDEYNAFKEIMIMEDEQQRDIDPFEGDEVE